MQPGAFEVHATDGAARAATLHTAHGPIETPAFMPVGTKASVKAMSPAELTDIGAQIVLGNTYHLHFRPGEDVIAELGGLHRFMGWDRPILTDSGGFQVFCCSHAHDQRGRRHLPLVYDGTPRGSRPRWRCGSRRASAPTSRWSSTSARRGARRARRGRRGGSHAALGRALQRRRAHPGSCASASARGRRPGAAPRLRRPLTAIPFDGFALGGLSVGESPAGDVRRHATRRAAAGRPAALPHGHRRPRGDPARHRAGIDMFDCVLPTRLGRTGSRFHVGGRLNLRNARFARDAGPLDATSPCPACKQFSRAYIRHLVTQQEVLGLRLLTVHNLFFLLNLTREARDAIRSGTFAAFRTRPFLRLASDSRDSPREHRRPPPDPASRRRVLGAPDPSAADGQERRAADADPAVAR